MVLLLGNNYGLRWVSMKIRERRKENEMYNSWAQIKGG